MDDRLHVVSASNQPDTFEAWREEGARLAQRLSRTAFEVGDWWLRGEHRHGARREMTEQPDWHGPSYKTIANAVWICQKFPESSPHRESLTFAHLVVVAALSEEAAASLLAWAARPAKEGKRPRSVNALREERARREAACQRLKVAVLNHVLSDIVSGPVSALLSGTTVPFTLGPSEPFPPYEVPRRTAADFGAEVDRLMKDYAGDVSLNEMADELAARVEAVRRKLAS